MSDTQGRIEGDAKQIGVIITDGRSTDVSATIREAVRARNQYNIDMIALGVGNETFLEELEAIAGSESRLFQVQNFAQLQDVVKHLEDIICEAFPCSRPADIVFLIDGSYSITAPDWVKGKQFISYLINSIDIGVNSIHVGLVVYGSDIGNVVPLSPYKNKTELKAAASALIQPPVGRTNTALGIKTVNDMFRSQGRPQVPTILIIITDGKSSNPSETKYQAGMAKQRGITVFVVGVGNQVVKEEMEDMATSSQTIFDAPDFKHLVGMVEVLRNNICTALCQQCLIEGGVGFNPVPNDCEQYVLCLPTGVTYNPVIKSCPFGMFWSHDAVACLDARFVDCPSDKCKSTANLLMYSSTSDGSHCRSYIRCFEGRSIPTCCDVGYRYKDDLGCVPDTTCNDSCPLDVTIYNLGACQFRPDHQNYYNYFEIIPGQGCLPSANMTFEGNFQDNSNNHQYIEVKKVGLSNFSTAVFNNDSFISLLNTANKDFGDRLVIRIKYRMQRKLPPGQIHTANNWGFQKWLNNVSSISNSTEILSGETSKNFIESSFISGSEIKPLEIITVNKNGSIIQDPQYFTSTNFTLTNSSQQSGHIIQLGKLTNISTSLVKNGILYTSNGKGKLLVQEANMGLTDSIVSKWSVLTMNADGTTGTLEETGEGNVPLAIQTKYVFDLHPPVVQKWAVLLPGGIVLQKGEGIIPPDVFNRYAGLTMGKLVKLFEQGDILIKWEISKPDGSDLQQGTGNIPNNLIDSLKLTSFLTPKQITAIWLILSANGDVLESGKGTAVPADVMRTYRNNPKTIVMKSFSKDGSSPIWELSRADGTELLQGLGPLPQGIAQFIRGDVMLPQISSVTGWKVQMPNGEVKSGTGPIPQNILNIILKQFSNDKVNGQQANGEPKLNQRWEVTLPNGSVQTGMGPLPSDFITSLTGQKSHVQVTKQVKEGSLRSRRAAPTYRVMNLLSNCGSSIEMLVSELDITMKLVTTNVPNGVSINLPVNDGINDVWMKYDGQLLTGIINGFVMKKPLSGKIVSSTFPITLGQCPGSKQNHFSGEIDLLEIYHCLP
ncbi:hypothetical protein Btru_059782 [Bulinus truncatus]|nr:hypothetical protein Btru_059782 [Bulinus truncatus]